MRRRLSGAAMLALSACATTMSAPVEPVAQLRATGEATPEMLLALNAICSAEAPYAEAKRSASIQPGVGAGGFKVDTDSSQAQDWFNYGLSLSHGFYHLDAIEAMRRSVEADPNCSMCAWGLAWALGPTLNYGIEEDERVEALAMAEKARALAKPGDVKAARLAEAMIARYAPEAAVSGERNYLGGARAGRGATEPAFGKAMAAIARDYPDEQEFAVLAAHSLMIPVRGGDERGLKPALAILEQVLDKHPDDTGAIHYYIHGTEFDKRPEDALRYAERLGKLAPAASHLVHMPAHTFFHAGQYHRAAVVNAKAIESDATWVQAGGNPAPPGAPDAKLPMYYPHNLAFGLAGALMSGDVDLALKFASHARKVFPDGAPAGPRGYVVPRTWVALGRHAPDEALALPEIGGDVRYAIYRGYARGEALLIKGDAAGAQAELRALKRLKGAGGNAEHLVAKDVLEGRIAMARGDMRAAASAFSRAARIQETRLADYWDPPSWWYPVRRSLAAAHLKAGDFAKAEAEAKASLLAWKHDPLALWVRGKAEESLGRASEAAATLAEARRLWRGDFDSITADAI